MADLIKLRRDIAANWNIANPVLANGELGFETDTNRFKLGNGSTAWNLLKYYGNEGDFFNVTNHEGASIHDLAEAISLVPTYLKKKGLVITYQISDTKWEAKQFTGDDLTDWTDEGSWTDFGGNLGYEEIDDVTIIPDSAKKIKLKDNDGNPAYAASHSDAVKMAGENKTLTQKMAEVDELQNKMLYTNLLTNVTTGTRSTSYITVSYDSENDATTFHCVAATGGYRAWINLPSGLVVGRQYKVVFDYTTNSASTVYVKISTNAGNDNTTTAAFTTFTNGSGHKEMLFTMASGIVHINIASLDIGIGKDVVLSHVKVYDMSDIYSLREVKDKIDVLDSSVNDVRVLTSVSLEGRAGNSYNMAEPNWAKNKGSHIVIPVGATAGSIAAAGDIIAITTTYWGHVAFLKSYNSPSSTSTPVPYTDSATVEHGSVTETFAKRFAQSINMGTCYYTVPSDAAYLCLNTKEYNGAAAGFDVFQVEIGSIAELIGRRKNEISGLASNVENLASDIANNNTIYETKEQVDISGYTVNNYNLAGNTWWSAGKHIKIPVADVGVAGDWIAITCNTSDSFIAFFGSYTTPAVNASFVNDLVEATVRVYVSPNDTYVDYTKERIYFANTRLSFMQIPEGTAYIIICTSNGNGVNVGAKLYKASIANVRASVQEILSKQEGSGLEYSGDKISLVRHYAKVTRLFKTPAGQATWYYNGYFFNCHLKEKNGTIISKFRLYQPNGTTLGNPVAEWDMESIVGFGYNGTDGVHANSIQLLNFKYANTDEFPIFTIEHNNGAAYGYTFVMRLYYANSQWNLVKLYNVIYPDSESTGGDKRIALHAFEDGTLYSYAGDFWDVLNGTHYIELYDKTKKITADRTTDLVLTAEDRIGQIESGFSRMHVYQAAFHFGNKLYQLDGDSWSYFHPESTASNKNNGTPNNYRNLPHLMVFDFTIEKCVNDILLNETFGIPDAEPEGICIVDGKMYISQNGENNDGYMYELEFD